MHIPPFTTASIMHTSLSGERIKDSFLWSFFFSFFKEKSEMTPATFSTSCWLVEYLVAFRSCISAPQFPEQVKISGRFLFFLKGFAKRLKEICIFWGALKKTFTSFRSRPLRAAAPCQPLDSGLMVMAARAASCQLTPHSLVINSDWWKTENLLALPFFFFTKIPSFFLFTPHPTLLGLHTVWLSSLHSFSSHSFPSTTTI